MTEKGHPMNPDRKTLADELEALRDAAPRTYDIRRYDIAFKCADNIDTILGALHSPVAGEDDIAGIILYGIVDDWENGALSQESYENAKKLSRVLAKCIVLLATPPTGESEIKPHLYSPSHQAMGDCLVCGHVQNKPWHTGESAPASDNLADAREFCVGAFGPLGVNIEPYVKIIVELMDGAVARYKRNACTSAGESAPDVGEDYKDDPTSDERWNAGLDFGMQQFCKALDVDPEKVTWDAATETVDGDVQAVIWNILRTRFGDDWDPDASPSAGNEIQSSED